MRVLHVLAETGYSGGELQLEHVVRHLVAEGHENSFILAPGAEFAEVATDRLRIDPARIHTVDLRRPLRPRVRGRFRRAALEEAPEVLHFGCGRSLLWGGLFSLGLWRADDRPLRVTTRRIDYPISRAPWKGGRYKHFVDHVVANCGSVARRVRAAGVPEDRVTVVHEGIEVEPWADVLAGRAEARRALEIPQDAIVVICPATLRPRKGQRYLIDAFERVLPQHPSALLILAGAGPDRDALIGHAAKLGAQVRVPGAVRPPEPLFACADVLAMPSQNEGLANACLEGSAAGLPLVVSDVGGLPEIVAHGETGLVVPPRDVAALAGALDHLLGDAALRRRMGAAGRARTRDRFTAAQSARGIESLWQRLLAAR